jgi:glycosyltransferase involved in cell wall biosynthesis
MKILQICSAQSIGGGERHVADLSNALSERGHDVFAAVKPNSPLRNLLNLSSQNIKTSRMKNALDILSARELAKFVREKEIEIIHAHLGRDYPLAAMCSIFSGKPYVLTRHVLFPMKSVNAFVLRRAAGAIAVSNAVSDALLKQKIFPAEKMTVINNGIDVKRFSPLEKKNTEKKIFRVGTIGALSQIKGHDVFLAAAAKVLQQNANVEFEIVGEDESPQKKSEAEIKQMISDMNLQNRVRLRGWLDDVRPFLHSLDLFVSASRFDAFGLVIAEAMACGIPMIVSETETAREIIGNENSGILFPINDSSALAAAILNLLENRKKREQLQLNARKRIEQYFSLDKMVDATEAFYRRATTKSLA